MSLLTIMQTSPQPWTITSILNHDYGRILLADAERACLQIGCFYFIEGPFEHTFAQQWLQQLTAPAIIISSNHYWYEFCLQHTSIGLKETWRCLYHWNNHVDALTPYLKGIHSTYAIRRIDKNECEQISQLDWAEGVFDSYRNHEDFINRGLGYCIYQRDRIISLCMSFAKSDLGIEIEVDTDPEYQGKGLAKIVAAHFMLETIKRGHQPLWDASNPASAKVAEALGFIRGREYLALSTF